MITKWRLGPKGVAYQFIILFFSLLLVFDCRSRILDGGLMPPSHLMVLFSVFISCLLLGYGSKILNQNVENKAIAIVAFALIPDAWIWYAYMHSAYKLTFVIYFNIPIWAILCILLPYYQSRNITSNTFLIIFFLKGFALFLSLSGFLGAPWLREQNLAFINIMLSVLRFLAFYQLFLLGLLWRWLEKKRADKPHASIKK